MNTFIANDKYSFLNRDNLGQPTHMQLSQESGPFSEFFSAVLKFRFDF